MATGFEVPVAKALAPIIGELVRNAKGALTESFKKWSVDGFAKTLARKLSVADKVKTIWSKDRETSLLSIYYPSKIHDEEGIPQTVDSINSFKDGNFVVEGIVGQGKSMFLRFLYLQELSGRGSGKLPIFIELRTLTDKRTLTQHIDEAIEKLDLTIGIDVFDYLARSGKVVLLLDGFDEVNAELVTEVVAKIEYLSEKYSNLKIIVTSRPGGEIQKSRLFKTVHLASLGSADYKGFFKKLGIRSDASEKIIVAISSNSREVSNLISTPLMLTLLVMVYESENEIPSEVPEFFEKLFTTVFTLHDKRKAGFVRQHYSGLSERKLQYLFEAFCFVVIVGNFGRSLSSDKFNEAFETAQKYSNGIVCESDAFKNDIVKVSCLMLEEGFDMLTFLHKSISEYFAAAFISRAAEGVAKKFYNSSANRQVEWSAVLAYLEAIDSYRYNKFYLIPSLEKFFNSINSTVEVRAKPEEFLDFYSKASPELIIIFRREDNSSNDTPYSLMGFTGFQSPPDWYNEIHDKIMTVLMMGVGELVPDTFTNDEILAEGNLFSPPKHGVNNDYCHLPFNNFMNRYGIESLSKGFVKFEDDLYEVLRKARELIAAEDGKQDIMDIVF
ncbi:NACHT domain-containing protein [Janthinobacterium lividum]